MRRNEDEPASQSDEAAAKALPPALPPAEPLRTGLTATMTDSTAEWDGSTLAVVLLDPGDQSAKFKCVRQERVVTAAECYERFAKVHVWLEPLDPCWRCPQGAELRASYAEGRPATPSEVSSVLATCVDSAAHGVTLAIVAHALAAKPCTTKELASLAGVSTGAAKQAAMRLREAGEAVWTGQSWSKTK